MCRRLLVPLLGAFALVAGSGLAHGQPLAPDGPPPPVPAVSPDAPAEPEAEGLFGAACRPGGPLDLSFGCKDLRPRALPMVGDFFGVRYNRAVVLPFNRTLSYSVFNPSATAATTVGLVPPRSQGATLGAAVSVDGGPATALTTAGVTRITLAPGSGAVVTASGNVNQVSSIVDLVAARSGIKVSEYDSARPSDRVYMGATFYGNVPDRLSVTAGPVRTLNGGTLGVGTPEVASSLVENGATFFDGTFLDQSNTAFVRERGQLTRQLYGFEKTVELGGIDGSFGVRVPVVLLTGSLDQVKNIGDVSLSYKAVVVGGFDTEDLVTLGLMVTLPTGPKLVTPQGEISSVLIQPWLGYYYTLNKFYLQGFTGFVVPTESKDTGFSYSSMALGLRMFEAKRTSSLVSFVAGQIEGHINTPFERPGLDRPIIVNDLFVGTAAMHVGFGDLSVLTLGFGSPFGGYRPYEYQATAMLNVNF